MENKNMTVNVIARCDNGGSSNRLHPAAGSKYTHVFAPGQLTS